ncbi:MAG: Aminoacyl-tRNA hydrolase, peptidyl-tRNA hydrolase, family [Candidatus Taylorbacteria bacterium]|nr:Aminoacyl-tRNA hydrolase, peptidyl-tRNA hydrolase, family [Candidatus Taylorbacteria bacterium]
MTYIIAGLGNPGEEYKDTRHNTGRMMLYAVAKACGVAEDDFKLDGKLKALVATGEIGAGKKKEKVKFIAPDNFMNNSGKSIGPLVTSPSLGGGTKGSPKKAEQLIVIYDDFSLPIGRIRISFNRSSGGHNGLESVIKAAKTEAFIRIRIGVAPEKANGTAKVPSGDAVIEKFILTPFKPAEVAELKKIAKQVVEAVEMLVTEDRQKAMSVFNAN